MRQKIFLLLLLTSLFGATPLIAQHTFGVLAGYGSSGGRFEPSQETKTIWGSYSGGVSWRYYGEQKFVGGFGIDLEFMQQGYSFVQNAALVEDKKDYLYYTRNLNSIVMPIVWQPHVYLFKKKLRVYIEAAATFSYNMSSTFENQKENISGDYPFKLVRDNRFTYGLAGGGGLALLIKQLEINFRARYYFGYGDIMKNRNKYSDNATDGAENPFSATPLRSPLDNINISIGVSYRFNKKGFNSWFIKPEKFEKNKTGFNFKE